MSWNGRNELALSMITFFRLVGLPLPCGAALFQAAPGALTLGTAFDVCCCNWAALIGLAYGDGPGAFFAVCAL